MKIGTFVYSCNILEFQRSYSVADKCQLLSLKAQLCLMHLKHIKCLMYPCILKGTGSICFSQKTHHVNIDWKIIFIVNEQTHWFMCTWSIGCDKMTLLIQR